MGFKTITLAATALVLSTNVSATTVFSVGQTVLSVDRSATFDSLTTNGINLVNYAEDSLSISVGDESYQGFEAFLPGDKRTTGFHYGSAGNSAYVSISGTDNQIFKAFDFLLGDGQGALETNVRWETYLNGVMVGSGLESGIHKGQVVGWTDAIGFDELRVAAAISEALPGFGNLQAIAIDDLRAQIELSAVPVPAAVWLLGSGLLGLVGIARSKKV